MHAMRLGHACKPSSRWLVEQMIVNKGALAHPQTHSLAHFLAHSLRALFREHDGAACSLCVHHRTTTAVVSRPNCGEEVGRCPDSREASVDDCKDDVPVLPQSR
jgi:predicted RNA-binding Zn-ribbon protein involved in translation (DUF1610 family)